MNVFARTKVGLGTAVQLIKGMSKGKYWWLVPLVLFLLPIAAVFVLLEAAPLVAPFVYTIF